MIVCIDCFKLFQTISNKNKTCDGPGSQSESENRTWHLAQTSRRKNVFYILFEEIILVIVQIFYMWLWLLSISISEQTLQKSEIFILLLAECLLQIKWIQICLWNQIQVRETFSLYLFDKLLWIVSMCPMLFYTHTRQEKPLHPLQDAVTTMVRCAVPTVT